jgi:hypothetical protein
MNKLVFFPIRPLKYILMFLSNAGAYPILTPVRWFNLGQAFSLTPTNIRLGWKGLIGINTPTYYKHLYITASKSLITLVPEVNVLNLFLLNLQMGQISVRKVRPF